MEHIKLNEEASTMYEAFGIEEDRAKELENFAMVEAFKAVERIDECDMKDYIHSLKVHCRSDQEFALACYYYGWSTLEYREKLRRNPIANLIKSLIA
ncbi:hypothetical protein [Phaeodactylibacter sp.]|uniref:hypothetical protein n=1 Tax=Phaeodactylibacter sp. TaxID=1940289 RepID=UPI0025D468CC|nr:hypothetical protein [Phaeodactylibacter sp.]MCI4650835.1 hypothetical protein [Phaeodactylibacter sp.]MCI5089792.1 hypothetical protein [Phaeodactylibacter sp.]